VIVCKHSNLKAARPDAFGALRFCFKMRSDFLNARLGVCQGTFKVQNVQVMGRGLLEDARGKYITIN
jgi:hypothetical protein